MTAIVQDLKERIDATIPPLLPAGEPRRVMLVDVPDFPNVGDQAILLGELAFLRRVYPQAAIGIFSRKTYSPDVDREMERADLLLLHGGGNFGDIWPHRHEFRLHVLERFAHKVILQFPQSFHFTDPASLDATRRAIDRVPALTLLARDRKGFAFASEAFGRTELCPDMAFALGPQAAAPPQHDFSCLMRTDKESLEDKLDGLTATFASTGASFIVNDWITNRVGVEKGMHGLMRAAIRNGVSAGVVARHGTRAYEVYARSRLRYGLGLLGRGRSVVTDRLHGMILATLLGRPRYIFDSLDGKVRAFCETWLSGDEGAVFMNSVGDFRDHIGASTPACAINA